MVILAVTSSRAILHGANYLISTLWRKCRHRGSRSSNIIKNLVTCQDHVKPDDGVDADALPVQRSLHAGRAPNQNTSEPRWTISSNFALWIWTSQPDDTMSMDN